MNDAVDIGAVGPFDIEVVNQFADKKWRMRNLYRILDENNREVLFVPNDMQDKFWEDMWYLNLILKCRQLGFCVSPSTRVLTDDLRWVPAALIQAGQGIIAVDENVPGGKGAARKMKSAVVEAVREVRRYGYKIRFDDGRFVICSGQHPWLSRASQTQSEWRAIENTTKKKLRVGTEVRWITKPWEQPAFEDGWAGGMLDGEGSLGFKSNTGARLCVSQLPGPVLDRFRQYLVAREFHFAEDNDAKARRPGKLGTRPVHKLTVMRMDEVFRLLGRTRPSRFIGQRWWEGKDLPGKRNGEGWATITSIEPLGVIDLVDLQTSAGTYIAEGFVSHNTTFIDLYILDDCIFVPNQVGGIIAHTIDDVKKIFRRKIKHPYDRLPPEIRDANRARNDSAQELVFENGSEISVGTTMRAGTLSYLHVSEFGYIAAKYPEKADEIVTGSFNTIHPGSFIFVESTGYGKSGHFYDMCIAGKRHKLAARPLSQLDFKYHFYPWWGNPKYTLPEDDARHVIFTTRMTEYFKRIERSEGIRLTLGQRAWYTKKKEWNGDLQGREFPSNDKEPFEVAVKGAIFAEWINRARESRRITKVPHDPALLVDTWWDIGRRAKNAIWFVQNIGMEYRVIHYHEDELRSIGHYCSEYLPRIAAERGFKYRHHLGPHDLETTDISQLKNKTRYQVASDLGVNFTVGKQWDQEDQIEAARSLIPLAYFDEENCAEGLAHLELFRYEWNENLQTYMDRYRHDEHSHAASAFMTGSMLQGDLSTGRPRAQVVENALFPT